MHSNRVYRSCVSIGWLTGQNAMLCDQSIYATGPDTVTVRTERAESSQFAAMEWHKNMPQTPIGNDDHGDPVVASADPCARISLFCAPHLITWLISHISWICTKTWWRIRCFQLHGHWNTLLTDCLCCAAADGYTESEYLLVYPADGDRYHRQIDGILTERNAIALACHIECLTRGWTRSRKKKIEGGKKSTSILKFLSQIIAFIKWDISTEACQCCGCRSCWPVRGIKEKE